MGELARQGGCGSAGNTSKRGRVRPREAGSHAPCRQPGCGDDGGCRLHPNCVRDHLCFDFVAYEINGHVDTNRNTAPTLIKLLRKQGYQLVLKVSPVTSKERPTPADIALDITSIAPSGMTVEPKLKPGDVLIFYSQTRSGLNGFHTGIVRSRDGSFDHFLQTSGKTGTAYTPQQITKLDGYHVGPGNRWTLQEFFAFSAPSADAEGWWTRNWQAKFGKPTHYPFLHSWAFVFRKVGTAGPPTKLTLKVNGTTGFATKTATLADTHPTAPAVAPNSNLEIDATVDRPLPAGWRLIVFHNGDPKSSGNGNYYTVCEIDGKPGNIDTHCGDTRPTLPSPGDDFVGAQVQSPQGLVFYVQIYVPVRQ